MMADFSLFLYTLKIEEGDYLIFILVNYHWVLYFLFDNILLDLVKS